MSGQSIADRVMAARHSIAGQGLAKAVHKSTTEEIMGPKRKHLDYLIACTREPNVNISQLATLLMDRTQNSSWVVVFKALITLHHLMNHGNERFTQYLASNNYTLNLNNFVDKTAVHGFDMSTYIRRYAKYLNEKALSYRTMAFDFCKVKRGKDDGFLRTMNEEKLLKTLPVLQVQVDSLLEFEISSNELNNGVINACFMLLFKDLIRLFACYNEGIINLLERYFDMHKKQCKESFAIYKVFLERMERVSNFLKVAENVGIDKGEIPDLAKMDNIEEIRAPASLLEALEDHLKSLEGTKKSNMPKPASVTSAINSLTAVSTQLSEDDKRLILEEEKARLEEMKKSKEEFSTGFAEKKIEKLAAQPSIDLFSANADIKTCETKLSDDLLNLGANDGGLASLMSQPMMSSSMNQNITSTQPQTMNNPFMMSASTQPTNPMMQSTNPMMQSTNPMMQSANPMMSSANPIMSAANPVMPAASTATNNPFSDSWNTTGTSDTKPDVNFATAFVNTAPVNDVMNIASSNPCNLQDDKSDTGFDGLGDLLTPLSTNTTCQPELISPLGIQGKDLDASLASLVGNLNMTSHTMSVQKQGGHQWNNLNNGSDKKKTGGEQWSSITPQTSSTITPQFQMPQYNYPVQQNVWGFNPQSQAPGQGNVSFPPQQSSTVFATPQTTSNDPFGAL